MGYLIMHVNNMFEIIFNGIINKVSELEYLCGYAVGLYTSTVIDDNYNEFFEYLSLELLEMMRKRLN